MTWLKDKALAGLRWVGQAFVWLANAAREWGNGIYDPPPRARKWFFFTAAAIFASGWLTFAFTNSWFYKPTVAYFTTMFEDGDVVLPEHVEPQPLPEVVTRLPSVPSVEVVCHDMSDTPQCEPVRDVEEVTKVIPAPIVEAPVVKKAVVKKRLTTRRTMKRKPYQTVWGF